MTTAKPFATSALPLVLVGTSGVASSGISPPWTIFALARAQPVLS